MGHTAGVSELLVGEFPALTIPEGLPPPAPTTPLITSPGLTAMRTVT